MKIKILQVLAGPNIKVKDVEGNVIPGGMFTGSIIECDDVTGKYLIRMHQGAEATDADWQALVQAAKERKRPAPVINRLEGCAPSDIAETLSKEQGAAE
jgi:hypothetical protein